MTAVWVAVGYRIRQRLASYFLLCVGAGCPARPGWAPRTARRGRIRIAAADCSDGWPRFLGRRVYQGRRRLGM